MRIFLISSFLALSSRSSIAQSNTPDPDTWVTNGVVNSVVHSGSTVYLGGDFSHVGPCVPFGVAIDGTTGLHNTAYVKPNGVVRAVVADGSGGWYIGGDFTTVGGVTRNRLARINSDGSLNAWNPNMGNPVYSLALSGGILYVGGNFTSAGGVTRNRIAAFDVSTGSLTSWNPNATSGIVNTIVVNGSTVYVGGTFTTVGGQARNRLAALDANTNTSNATAWNPNVGGTVNTLALSGGILYVGGLFSTVAPTGSNVTRNKIAAFDVSTGNLLDWNPGATGGNVNAIVVSGSTVYVGGTFTTIGGAARNRIAALDATVNTSNAISWNPDADFAVNALMISGTTVYACGEFQNIGGAARPCIAALNANTGLATSWNPKAGRLVRAFAENSGTIYAGGDFSIIGGELRNKLAALDATTGQANAWNPNADGVVTAMLMHGGVLYVGGGFSNVGGVARGKIAAIDPVSGVVSAWDPSANNSVASLAASGDTIYAGGTFTTIAGQTRNRIAALSATTGLAYAWNANVSGKVNGIAVSGGKVYFGGEFTGANAVNGTTTRNYLAAVNTSDGIVTSWNPNASNLVYVVAVNAGVVYVVGEFVSFNPSGTSAINRTYIAALDASNAVPTAWKPDANNTVSALAFSGSMVYAARGFNLIGGATRTNAAGLYLNVNTNNATPWNPSPGSFVYCIAVGSNKVFLGGGFSTVDGAPRTNFASYTISSVSWGGSTGGNFSDAARWAPGIAPSSTMDAVIPHGAPILDADHTIPSGKSLTISGTGSISVAAGKTLTIAGTANFGGKSVSLRSSAAGTAAIGQITGSLSNATNVTVERYLPAGRKWRLLGAPLSGSTNNSVFYNWQNNDVVTAGKGVEIWGPGGSADPSSSNNGLALGIGTSMRSYDAGWQNVTNTNSSLLFDATTNIGYALFQTGPYNNGSTAYIGGPGNTPAAVSTTLSATGSLITGTHTKNLTAATAGQYFLVANPYASPVDPASFTNVGTVNRSNLDNTLHMWDAKPGGTNGLGRYVSYDISAGQYSSIAAGTGFTAHTTQIQSGQAFFVRATNAGAASLTFRESSKGTIGSHDMMGDARPVAPPALRLQLWQDTIHYDGAVAYFHAGASRSIDQMDGIKILNGSDNLGFRRDGKTLVFEHHPELAVMDTLFLQLGQLRPQTYKLRIEGDGLTLPAGMEARLVDNISGLETQVDINRQMDVIFSIGADSAGTAGRFMIVFRAKPGAGVQASEPVVSNMFKVFPNPLAGVGEVTVTLDAAGAPWELKVTDQIGRTLWQQQNVREQRKEIPASRFAAGTYHVIAINASGVRFVSELVRQ